MGASKNYRTYPEVYHDLIRRAAIGRIEIPCEDSKGVAKLRGHLYAFFGALKRAAHDKETPEDIRELHHMSEKVKLMDAGNMLVAMPRDDDPRALQIKAALESQSPIVGGGTPSGPSAKLLEALEKSKGGGPRE